MLAVTAPAPVGQYLDRVSNRERRPGGRGERPRARDPVASRSVAPQGDWLVSNRHGEGRAVQLTSHHCGCEGVVEIQLDGPAGDRAAYGQDVSNAEVVERALNAEASYLALLLANCERERIGRGWEVDKAPPHAVEGRGRRGAVAPECENGDNGDGGDSASVHRSQEG